MKGIQKGHFGEKRQFLQTLGMTHLYCLVGKDKYGRGDGQYADSSVNCSHNFYCI